MKKVTYAIQYITFYVLDFFARRGSRTAHKLACLMLPYQEKTMNTIRKTSRYSAAPWAGGAAVLGLIQRALV